MMTNILLRGAKPYDCRFFLQLITYQSGLNYNLIRSRKGDCRHGLYARCEIMTEERHASVIKIVEMEAARAAVPLRTGQ